jgi:hypothetical protein
VTQIIKTLKGVEDLIVKMKIKLRIGLLEKVNQILLGM